MPVSTTLCGSDLPSIFKRLVLIQAENWHGQSFQYQGHSTKYNGQRCWDSHGYVVAS